MRARVVPPYPSFSYVMSQIGDPLQDNKPGSHEYDNTSLKFAPRPYSKYDDNPFMVRRRNLTSIGGMKQGTENHAL